MFIDKKVENPAMKRRRELDVGRITQKETVEAKLADACFRKVKFLGTAHEEIYKGVCALRRDVDPAFHYSVYAALVQTSGVGKTRAVMEMSKLGVYICYCSLAGKSSSAYPPRTGALADKLDSTYSEESMVLYLKAWLLILDEAIREGVSPEQWKEMQLPGGNVAKMVLERWQQFDASSSDADTEMEDATDPDEANRSVLLQAIEAVESGVGARHSARVIFVFDEARGLLHKLVEASESPFYQMRRALRVFFNHMAFFALMLDTSAKVSNLLPRRSDEDSSRALKVGINLLHPLYFLPNMGLHKPEPGLSMSNYADPMNWLRHGRPLWAARLDLEGDPSKVLQLARQKLVCVLQGEFQGVKVDLSSGDMTESQAVAILTAAAGLDICPRSALAEVMAASHMNLVLRVSKDRCRLYVRLPPEPIVAEAAADILRKDIVKEKALMHLEAACVAGYVAPGPRGEFVAKFILVAAMWSLKESMDAVWCLQQIPVQTFLQTLLSSDPETFHARVQQRVEVVGGRVFFNSFAAVRSPPDEAVLGSCYAGGHAIMYSAENGLPGADMIIPVWTPNGMTAIVVAVKNMASAGWLETVPVDKVKCEFTEVQVAPGLPVVTIVMSLRETDNRSNHSWLLWEDLNAPHVHITCYGIEHNFSFLSERVKEMLRKVLVTVPDPVAGASTKEVSWIHQMLHQEFQKPDERFTSLAQ